MKWVKKGDDNDSTEDNHDKAKEELSLCKSVDEDKRLFTAVVLRPEVPDSHDHIYSEEVVQKACHDYNEFCREGNLQHLIQTQLVVPVESHIASADQTMEYGSILKGDWVMTVRVDDDTVWDMCKDGSFTGFSIGCDGLIDIEDTE
jgi:hypothetical protein